jgi:alkanesulfonate monooxygenase SsuD/methylene tetrahydromethanopterin reductase-like flavin-dependent oxidoreductase (luciferase family)
MAADYSGDIERATEQGAIIGDPAECAQRIERLREVGADYVLLIERRNDPATLQTLAREVWPRLAAAGS